MILEEARFNLDLLVAALRVLHEVEQLNVLRIVGASPYCFYLNVSRQPSVQTAWLSTACLRC